MATKSDVVKAFANGYEARVTNWEARVDGDIRRLFVFGNCIAKLEKSPRRLTLDTCGHNTVTTMSGFREVLKQVLASGYRFAKEGGYYVLREVDTNNAVVRFERSATFTTSRPVTPLVIDGQEIAVKA